MTRCVECGRLLAEAPFTIHVVTDKKSKAYTCDAATIAMFGNALPAEYIHNHCLTGVCIDSREETVTLQAITYLWECPICRHAQETERESVVTCDNCCAMFTVDMVKS
jgi:hypothetical protein